MLAREREGERERKTLEQQQQVQPQLPPGLFVFGSLQQPPPQPRSQPRPSSRTLGFTPEYEDDVYLQNDLLGIDWVGCFRDLRQAGAFNKLTKKLGRTAAEKKAHAPRH